MRVVLATVGTDGDVFPYLGLGSVLRARGHSVTCVASEHYEPLAKRHDLAFQPLVSAQENQELFGHPDFWHPLKNAPLMARWGVRFLRRQYDLLSRLAGRETVLVANPGVLAAALVHEKLGVPLTHLILQPWMIPSSVAPPMMPNFTFLARAPRPVWRMFWRALDAVVYLLMGRELNGLRATLGLRPARRIVQNWLSKQLVIGLFPDWYGRPQADWPAQMRLTGFPLCDGGEVDALPPNVLEFCREPVVAFTFGTGMAHPAHLFRAALEACEMLGARGIFLTRYRDQLPHSLPPSVLHCAFVPFRRLFPQCAAVLHHGGIGTVAEAMAAGLPQLIHPLCFDQIDNGMRVKRLGVGDCLRATRCHGKQIAKALAALMTGECRARCRELTMRFAKTDALAAAADFIEELVAARPPSR